jgi:hypothetical protein
MALRMSPTSKRDKEKLRQLKLREEQENNQDYKGNKEVVSQSIKASRNEMNISQLFRNQRLYFDTYLKTCQQVFTSIADRNSFLLAK